MGDRVERKCAFIRAALTAAAAGYPLRAELIDLLDDLGSCHLLLESQQQTPIQNLGVMGRSASGLDETTLRTISQDGFARHWPDDFAAGWAREGDKPLQFD